MTDPKFITPRMTYATRLILGGGVLALFAILTINSFLATQGDTTWSDFALYWSAGRHYLHSEPLYSVARDGFHPYKYPPWATLLFVPFSLLPLAISGVLWRLVQVACLAYLFRWSWRLGGFIAAAVTLISFWGFWNLNVLAGQPNLLWIALAIYGFETLERRTVVSTTLLAITLSAKVFHVFSLIGIKPSRWRLKAWVGAATFSTLSCIPALLAYPMPRLRSFLAAYHEAASGGGSVLGGGGYGLPCLFTDLLSIPRENTDLRALFFLPSAGLGVLAYWGVRRSVTSPKGAFAAALALGAAVHPLAYAYTFAFGYPFAAMSLRDSGNSRHWGRRILAWLGIAAIVAMNDKTLGTVGTFLEAHQIKSLGIFVLALSYLPGFLQDGASGGPSVER